MSGRHPVLTVDFRYFRFSEICEISRRKMGRLMQVIDCVRDRGDILLRNEKDKDESPALAQRPKKILWNALIK